MAAAGRRMANIIGTPLQPDSVSDSDDDTNDGDAYIDWRQGIVLFA